MPPAGGSEYYNPQETEQQLNRMVTQAVEAAARGENVDQLLEVMLQMVPGPAKDALRKKFAAALAKRKLRAPGNEVADVPSRETLSRLRNMFMLSARQALDRILNLMRNRPDLAASIQQAGKMLVMNGVVVDRVNVTEEDLGNMKPLGAPSAGQQRADTGRTV